MPDFITWLFVDHWFITTVFFPGFTAFYAVFSDQWAWFWCALVWKILLMSDMPK